MVIIEKLMKEVFKTDILQYNLQLETLEVFKIYF